jgi:hypothetical protein
MQAQQAKTNIDGTCPMPVGEPTSRAPECVLAVVMTLAG